jgi:hypothetical protein
MMTIDERRRMIEMKKKKKKKNAGRVGNTLRPLVRHGWSWAWVMQLTSRSWGVCHWSYPTKAALLRSKKPSPEAYPQKIKMTLPNRQ